MLRCIGSETVFYAVCMQVSANGLDARQPREIGGHIPARLSQSQLRDKMLLFIRGYDSKSTSYQSGTRSFFLRALERDLFMPLSPCKFCSRPSPLRNLHSISSIIANVCALFKVLRFAICCPRNNFFRWSRCFSCDDSG